MNFKALQHGAEFNPKEVPDCTHFYPFGLDQKNARFGMRVNYEDFLKDSNCGPILGITFDCFAYHMHRKFDISKCPTSLTEGVLSDKKEPLSFDGVTMFSVKFDN